MSLLFPQPPRVEPQRRPDKRNGVPKAFRQYAKRYGAGVDDMLRMHKQVDVPMLDHWRDRLSKKKADVPETGHG